MPESQGWTGGAAIDPRTRIAALSIALKRAALVADNLAVASLRRVWNNRTTIS
jgi:hypothetical protein